MDKHFKLLGVSHWPARPALELPPHLACLWAWWGAALRQYHAADVAFPELRWTPAHTPAPGPGVSPADWEGNRRADEAARCLAGRHPAAEAKGRWMDRVSRWRDLAAEVIRGTLAL